MSIYHEKMWECLETKAHEADANEYPDRHVADKYLAGIRQICDDAVALASKVGDTFPMYTRHDEVHIVNVMRIMWNLLGNSQERLTRDEAAMLVLAACCHDVGMSYSPDEKDEILGDIDSLNQYLEQHHDEYVKAYKDGSDIPKMTGEMIRSYLRSVHPQRAARWIHDQQWPDMLNGKVDKADVATVCQSHGNDVAALDTLEAKPNVDLRMCAILLRLADILDFDTSRAPRAIYDYCGFNRKTDPESIISREEWQKHMASHGFEFPPAVNRAHPYELPYKATCTSMQIEQAIQSYLDWVDRELLGCSKELRLLDERLKGFALPRQIKRIITPDGYVSGQYRLTLEQDRIIELLAGEDLYSDPSVFVRELLQNAIDAVRTRQQLDRNLPRNWKPQINIRTWMDNEGYHWFRIEDNGIGMTRTIIENFRRMDIAVTLKFDLMGLPWYKKWFARIAGYGYRSIAIHNGLIATDDFFSFKQYGYDNSLTICSVMLLADKFRPNLNLARNSIRSMPLHAHIRIEALLRKLAREDSSFKPEGGFLDGYNNTYLPASAYESILQEDNSLAHILVVELDDNKQCSVDSIQAAKGFNDAIELKASGIEKRTPYDNCCLAYLQKNYELKLSLEPWLHQLYVGTKETRINDEALSLYPPAFFMMPSLENDTILAVAHPYLRHGINSSHRLSKFLLSNAQTLHEQMPGIFSEFVRTLVEDTPPSKSNLIDNVNGLLRRIRSFPDSPIQVPDDVFITEDDLKLGRT